MKENDVNFFNIETDKLCEALSKHSGAFSNISKKLKEQGLKLSRENG